MGEESTLARILLFIPWQIINSNINALERKKAGRVGRTERENEGGGNTEINLLIL